MTEETIGYSVGDVVQLKSGGPLMTVKQVAGEAITVLWFDLEGEGLHENTLPAACVMTAEFDEDDDDLDLMEDEEEEEDDEA